MKRLFFVALFALCALATSADGQTRLKRGPGEVSINASGDVNIKPASGRTVTVGNGSTALSKILSASVSLDFGATAAGACDALTITVAGAADGDTVALGIPAALAGADTYQNFWAYVSAADTVTVKRCNPINATTALSNPAAATVRATVIKF
jgi:hypothetical protein